MKNKKNNQGFLLIELIVVVAIMAVMTGIGGYALSMIASTNAKECAQELNAALVRTRTQSYSTDSATGTIASVTLYRDAADGCVYVNKSYESAPEKIGGARVKVYFKLKNGNYEELVNQNIVFSFNRSTGAFRNVLVDVLSGEIESLQVTSGSKTYTIVCHTQTGKTTVE